MNHTNMHTHTSTNSSAHKGGLCYQSSCVCARAEYERSERGPWLTSRPPTPRMSRCIHARARQAYGPGDGHPAPPQGLPRGHLQGSAHFPSLFLHSLPLASPAGTRGAERGGGKVAEPRDVDGSGSSELQRCPPHSSMCAGGGPKTHTLTHTHFARSAWPHDLPPCFRALGQTRRRRGDPHGPPLVPWRGPQERRKERHLV